MNGKGSKPRSNYSERFRENFSAINWLRKGLSNVYCGKPNISPVDKGSENKNKQNES
jgi:hypothetical protein